MKLRQDRGLAAFLGPQGDEALAALDRLEAEVVQTALGGLPGALPPASAGVSLVSYVRPSGPRHPADASPMTLGLVTVFMEPMVEAALDSGKTPFNKTSREDKPAAGGRPESGTFTWTADYSGGLLRAGFDGSFTTHTGAPPDLKSVTEAFTLQATITPCPNAVGQVPIEVTYTEDLTTTSATVNSILHVKVTMHALVTVDDSAEIAGTAVTAETEASDAKTTSGGEETQGSAESAMTFGLGSDGIPTDIGITSATIEGDATAGSGAGNWARFVAVFLSPAVASATKTARSGWRNDKCVQLEDVTPESKEVAAKEKIDIAATLKHRVTNEEVQKKVKATVQGKGTIEPAEADGPKVQYVYTAGESSGDTGSVELKSVSNRGIASKTLTFSIRGKWTLAVHGTFTEMLGAAVGGMTFGADLKVAVDPFPLNVDESGKITGTGTIHFSGHPVFPPGTPCTGSYDSIETLNVTGTQTTPDGVSKLSLSFSAPPGTVKSSMNCPGGIAGSTQFNMAGGFGGNLTNTLASTVIAIPAAGGSVSVDEKGTSSVWNTHAVLAFELLVAE